VAFMLMHCFWLLEFKFKFEFYLFERFSKCSNLLFPKLSTFSLFGPAARRSSSRGLANRPSSRASQPAKQPPRPAKHSGPVGLPAQAVASPLSAACVAPLSLTVGPACHLLRLAVSQPDSAASPTRRHRARARVALASTPMRFPGLFKAAPPPRLLTRAIAATPPSCAVAETLASTAVFDSQLLSLSRRREAVQGLRQEVSFTPVPFVVEFMNHSTLEPSPEFHRRRRSPL
jgi:hypothetical protein